MVIRHRNRIRSRCPSACPETTCGDSGDGDKLIDRGPARRVLGAQRVGRVGAHTLTLVIAMAILGGIAADWRRAVNQQWNATFAVEQLGGAVDYVWRWDEQVHPLPGFMRFQRSVGWVFPGDSRVVGVNLTGCRCAELDETLRHVLAAVELRSLNLADAGITNTSLAAVAGQSRLEFLNLYGTPITDEGLRQCIPQLKHLHYLDVRRTNITRSGWLQACDDLPGVCIRSDFEDDRRAAGLLE